ncbi:hypothetical protein ACET3Z_022866 [Daucus carota]
MKNGTTNLQRTILQKLIFVTVKVKTVQETSWWHYSCPDCSKEMAFQDGKYKYSGCPKVLPVTEERYRIPILGEDSTEACNFVLID